MPNTQESVQEHPDRPRPVSGEVANDSGLHLAQNGGYVLPLNPADWFQTNTGEALDINLSAAVAVGGSLTYGRI